MMATAAEWDLIQASPFAEVKPLKRVKQPFSFWTPEERDRFLEGCGNVDPDFSRAVLIASHTGLRLGELAGLRWESVNLSRRSVTVRESFNYKLGMQLDHTKNREAVDIPINSLVVKALSELKLLRGGEETVLPRRLLQTACHKLRFRCRLLGVPEIRFHDLRHTFASSLAMAGVDLMAIKELMRHKSYQMTLRYAHLHPEYLAGKTEVLCSSGPKLPRNFHEENSAGLKLACGVQNETQVPITRLRKVSILQ